MQSRLMSMIEAWVNVAIGLVISAVTNAIVLPLFGFHPTVAQVTGMTSIFTVVSIVRSYLLRRFFNRLHHRGS